LLNDHLYHAGPHCAIADLLNQGSYRRDPRLPLAIFPSVGGFWRLEQTASAPGEMEAQDRIGMNAQGIVALD
jgi:hypothetical protein